MAIPSHLKIVFRGVFENTEEEWSFSTKWHRTVSASPDAGVNDINDAAVTNAISALIGASGTARFSSSILATEWRAYVIGTNGRMEGNPKQVLLATPVRGTNQNTFPSSTSLVITTVADNRGPARFGRFFLPGPACPLTDFRLTVAQAQAYGAVATAFVKSVSGAIDLPGTIESSAMVNASVLPAPGGTLQDVDRLEVGRVLDNLSTRRRQLDEERESAGQIDW